MSTEYLIPALCRYLGGSVSGLVFDETGVAGNVFDSVLPQTPHEIVSVREYGGPEPDSREGWDEVHIQIRVRGPVDDPRPPRARINLIRAAIEGLTNVTLPQGPYAVLVHLLAQPAPMDGVDSQGRYEWVLNLSAHVRNQAGLRV